MYQENKCLNITAFEIFVKDQYTSEKSLAFKNSTLKDFTKKIAMISMRKSNATCSNVRYVVGLSCQVCFVPFSRLSSSHLCHNRSMKNI